MWKYNINQKQLLICLKTWKNLTFSCLLPCLNPCPFSPVNKCKCDFKCSNRNGCWNKKCLHLHGSQPLINILYHLGPNILINKQPACFGGFAWLCPLFGFFNVSQGLSIKIVFFAMSLNWYAFSEERFTALSWGCDPLNWLLYHKT